MAEVGVIVTNDEVYIHAADLVAHLEEAAQARYARFIDSEGDGFLAAAETVREIVEARAFEA